MTSSHHFSPSRQVSARLAPLVGSSAVFLPRWSETSVSPVSSSLKYWKYKGRFAVKHEYEVVHYIADTVDALTATFVV